MPCFYDVGGGAIAVFDPTAFQTGGQFPEFNGVPTPTMQGYAEAGDILDNGGLSPISDTAKQTRVMNLLTAHLAALFSGVNGQAPSGLVGRVSGATEGSVSVTTDNGTTTSDIQAFLQQTQYGNLAWIAMAPFRRGRYIPAPGRRGWGYRGLR